MDHKIILLDGAMGTMLQQNGLKPGDVPELMNLTHPALIESIHRSYLEAGSRIVYANTFGVNRRKLAGTGHRVLEVTLAAIQNARRAAKDFADARVALDIGPLGELLEPMGTLTFEQAYDLYAELAEAGEKAGADLAVIETMTDLYETKAALLAVKEKTSLPVFVTMSFDENGRTFTGCTVESMARTLEGLGADAIGVNCSLGPDQLGDVIRRLCRSTRLPVIAKPNAGLPDPVDGHYDLSPEDFAASVLRLTELGVSYVGGCCGTNPDYIRALAQAVEGKKPGERETEKIPFVCTPVNPLPLTGIRIIGERINPTGKKRFQQALLEKDLDYIVDVALQQIDAGAHILDVNVGHPGVDEVEMLPKVVKALQAAVQVPLQLDSTNPAALEAALRVYNGKAAVNSVNGKTESMQTVLPIVKKYGAAVVGLCLDENGLPQSAKERIVIAERILQEALRLGIPREDVWIDCLTLTVSAQQDQAEETLKAVRHVHEVLGLRTVLGVSNISFGLPNRPLITSVFLARALSAGLTLPIINPNQREVLDVVAAFRVLNGEDVESRAYIDRFAAVQAAPKAQVAAPAQMTLSEAIIRGLRGDAARLASEALASVSELELVEQHLIPALDRVGSDYEKGAAFLPQLLSAAQAAQSVFEIIRSSLAAKGTQRISRGRIVIATVEGDIHDIGKNIVKTVLENYGYDVIDLGRDVPPKTVCEAVQREGIRLVGLSALMTTTLPAMEETVRQLLLLPNPPQIMVGGAVVTPDYAERIHAIYANDAREAVSIARRVFGEEKEAQA